MTGRIWDEAWADSQSVRNEVEHLSLAEFMAGPFLKRATEIEQPDPEAKVIPHFERWARMVGESPYVGIVAFRNSLKSVFAKGVIAYDLRCHEHGVYEGHYFSATQTLAADHLRKLKLYLEPLAEEWGWRDMTSGRKLISYERPGALFTVTPLGVDSRTRGRRANRLVLDDLLDPLKPLSLVEVDRVLEAVRRRILPMLKSAHAQVLFCGTPIVEGDAVDWVRANASFKTDWLPIVDAHGGPTWPELYPLDRIAELRALVGAKAFEVEYMLKQKNVIDSYVHPDLLAQNTLELSL